MIRPTAFICLALSLVLLAPLVSAQFGGFFQHGFPFGGHGPHAGHGQHHEEGRPGRAHRGWGAMDEVHCRAGYVCPGSLACVPTPADCPCPYPEDKKCVIPDDRERDEGEGPPFVCTRGDLGCDEVVQFSKPI
ncbi:hypothetical protein IAT40_004806 [Kwoniella sp. CBS 6097]